MRSLQSRIREKILVQEKQNKKEVDDSQLRKTCWLCGSTGSPRFRLRDHTSLCFICFRTVYFELLLPRIDNDVRARHTSQIIRSIDKLVEEGSADARDSLEVFFPSQLSASRFSRESSPLTAAIGWDCPLCTYSNPDKKDNVCAACGFQLMAKACVCEQCGVDCSSLKNSKCRNGAPHVIWYCEHCKVFNTLDDDYCKCGKNREWVCSQCTQRHSYPRNQDGLRYCNTCCSYNTPDDVVQGQITVDLELHHLRTQELAKETVFGVNDSETLRQKNRQVEIDNNYKRLMRRLKKLDLRQNKRVSDGNCLFAAIANQLFGREEISYVVRLMIVQYMENNIDEYALLFDGKREMMEYLRKMKQNGTWGDELCLNAAARCFRVDIHVLSSTEGRWHLVFRSDDLATSKVQPKRGKVKGSPIALFLSYQSPVHYEDIELDGVKKINFTDYVIPELQKIIEAEGCRPPTTKENNAPPPRVVVPVPLNRSRSKSINQLSIPTPPQRVPARCQSALSLK